MSLLFKSVKPLACFCGGVDRGGEGTGREGAGSGGEGEGSGERGGGKWGERGREVGRGGGKRGERGREEGRERGREARREGEGSGDRGEGKRGERGREAGIEYPRPPPLLWLNSMVCVGPGRKSQCWFSLVAAQLDLKFLLLV